MDSYSQEPKVLSHHDVNMALIALTNRGASTAFQLAGQLGEPVDIYRHEHCTAGPPARPFRRLRELMPLVWTRYRVLVFIMATGIVVRHITGYLAGKDKDPAVLVLDDNGKFVISLLSGHLGGANALARYIAGILSATPVITTATDGRGLTAPDEYARRYGWRVYPLGQLPRVNRLLLERGYLVVGTVHELADSNAFRHDENYLFQSEPTGRQVDVEISAFPRQDDKLYLVPPVVSVGVGCRRGIGSEQILLAVEQALSAAGVSTLALKGLYSIELKAGEPGLGQAATQLGISFATFSGYQIQQVNLERNLAQSEFVKEKVGVTGVCEAASLLGANLGTLILPKRTFNGVTVALSLEKSLL